MFFSGSCTVPEHLSILIHPVISRVVAMALRAKQSHNALDRTSRTLTRYMQVSWGTGYISLATALTTFLRALLVNATLPSSSSSSSPATHVESGSDGFIIMEEAPRAVTEEDRLNDRLWYRRVFDVTNWLYLVATVLGIVSLIQGLRYASHRFELWSHVQPASST